MIELASPDIRPEDIQRVVRVLESGNLVQGPEVEAFETALGDFIGNPCCAAVSSGTAALHLALLALDIGPGDCVVVPAFTFPASANAVVFAGAEVLLCDVELDSYVVTAAAIERVLLANPKKNIKAVMVVHEFGYPVDVAAVREVTDRYGLRLIEDAACALGSFSAGRHVGQLGDIACFSFHPRKAITTGEGGAVTSRQNELVEKVKELRNHGMRRQAGAVEFSSCGLNYRLTDVQAALGIGQLKRFGRELDRRAELASRYLERLIGIPGISLPKVAPGHSWQSFMVVLDAAISRDRVIQQLVSDGIRVNLGAQALSCLPCYRDLGVDTECQIAQRLYESGLVLPLYGKLSVADIEYVADHLKKAVGA